MKPNLKIIAKSAFFLLASSSLLFFGTGCASSQGEFRGQGTSTGVSLSQNNYTIVKTAAKGQSSGFRLLGILPIANPSYANAKVALYDSVGESLTGRSIALANQTEDRSSLYLILFSIPKITVTADVIEFNDSDVK